MTSLFILCFIQSVGAGPLDRLVETYHREKGFQGVVSIHRRDEVLYQRAWGYTDISQKELNRVGTTFRIGSLTKSLTAIASLVILDERGISLDTPIYHFIPAFRNLYPQLSFEHLLRMQSGFPNHLLRITERQDLMFSEMVDLIAQTPPLFEPGDKTEYSNCNYHVLAKLLEILEKRTYEEIVRTRVFQPMGMVNSFIEREPAVEAKGHGLYGKKRALAADQNMALAFGSGDAVSNAGDLVRYARAILRQRPPFGDFWQHLTTSQDPENHYTMGWRVKPYSRPVSRDGTLVRHGGSMQGYLCNLHIYLEDELIVLVLANIRPFPVMEFTLELADIALRIETEK